jgi:hypothetical protein
MGRVRIAARDPGGANVLAALLARHGAALRFDAWSLPRATPVFARVGVAAREFPEAFDQQAVRAAWMAAPADFLVTGTSHYDPFEPLLWALARETGAGSLAVVDGWANLALRFVAGKPDYVGAVDAGQMDELAAMGFSRERILLTGHPWLSLLVADRERILAQTRPAATGPGLHVLFASEAVAADVAKGVNAPYGFDEFEAYAVVHRAAVRAASASCPMTLAVKFHPYEDSADFLRRRAALPGGEGLSLVTVEASALPHPWVLWADLVTGVTSMLLLEAIVLGRPVVSVQPGLAREDTFIASARGFAEALTDPGEAEDRLGVLMSSETTRAAVRAANAGFLSGLPEEGSATILELLRRCRVA